MHGNLLVSADAEGSHGVASWRLKEDNGVKYGRLCVVSKLLQELTLGVNGLLVGQLLEHLGSASKSITRLTNAAVDDHLVNF